MRIVLIGQAAFAARVLERLLQRQEEVVGVYCPPHSAGRPDPLKETAKKARIPVFQPRRLKAPGVWDEYKKLGAELNILAFVTDIAPGEILQYPRHGSIQYHPSLLPRHRGRSAINWSVIQGEKKTGLSIFWVDEGIDTGPILLQKEVEIDPDDTTGSLYFNKLFPLGVDALLEALDRIEAGTAPRIVQDAAQATYEPPCDETHARIDWHQPLQEVYDLIRGCDPQPGAHTSYQGRRVQLYASKALLDHQLPPGTTPGEIVDVRDEGLLVAGNGGAVLVQTVRPEGGEKGAAGEFAGRVGLRKGEKLE